MARWEPECTVVQVVLWIYINADWCRDQKHGVSAKYGPQMQFGGTTKYVALKICVATGHSSKLAMLRKLPEVTNSDLPPLEAWLHGDSHGTRVGTVAQ